MNIREKILVIEDEKTISHFISTILNNNGYEAMQARTANFCTKIPDYKPIPRKTKGMRTLVSTENTHAYFLGCI